MTGRPQHHDTARRRQLGRPIGERGAKDQPPERVPDGRIGFAVARRGLEATSSPADDGSVRFHRADVSHQLRAVAGPAQIPGETEQRQQCPGQAVDQEDAHALLTAIGRHRELVVPTLPRTPPRRSVWRYVMRPRFHTPAAPLGMTVLLIGSSLAMTGCDQASPTAATSSSNASFKSESTHAAVVIRNAGCGLFDGAGEVVPADRDMAILTQSTRQNTTVICKVKKVSNPTGRAVKYDSEHNPLFPGLECGTFLGATTSWLETISTSGNATLRCHFKRGAAPPDTLPPPDTVTSRLLRPRFSP
jgi:hypothetical protein